MQLRNKIHFHTARYTYVYLKCRPDALVVYYLALLRLSEMRSKVHIPISVDVFFFLVRILLWVIKKKVRATNFGRRTV